MRATIVLSFASEVVASQVGQALLPDNRGVPDGLRIRMGECGPILTVVVECDKGAGTLRNTIDDILEAVDVTLRTRDAIFTAATNES